MKNRCSILIKASPERVFEVTSDVIRWPAFLPHYRWVRWMEGGPDQGILHMGALRGALPISWVSEFRRDVDGRTLHFLHRSAMTRGMKVRWIYEDCPEGVRVTIVHDLEFRVPLLAPLAEAFLGGFLIDWVAPRTLSAFRHLLEARP